MLVAAENRPWKYQADVSSLMVLTSKFCSLIYLCLYECDHKYDKNVVSIGSNTKWNTKLKASLLCLTLFLEHTPTVYIGYLCTQQANPPSRLPHPSQEKALYCYKKKSTMLNFTSY